MKSIAALVGELDSALGDFFDADSRDVFDALADHPEGKSAIEPLFGFLEENGETDLGAPGPVVHFIESFPVDAYIEPLVASILRAPGHYTLWMVNRILNATPGAERRRRLLALLGDVGAREDIDPSLCDEALEYVMYQRSQ